MSSLSHSRQNMAESMIGKVYYDSEERQKKPVKKLLNQIELDKTQLKDYLTKQNSTKNIKKRVKYGKLLTKQEITQGQKHPGGLLLRQVQNPGCCLCCWSVGEGRLATRCRFCVLYMVYDSTRGDLPKRVTSCFFCSSYSKCLVGFSVYDKEDPPNKSSWIEASAASCSLGAAQSVFVSNSFCLRGLRVDGRIFGGRLCEMIQLVVSSQLLVVGIP